MFDPTRHIAITGVDMRTFIMAVYELSKEVGMGQIMYRSGLLDREMVELIMAGHRQRMEGGSPIVLHMDYVHGRACKMVVYREHDILYISSKWFDHSEEDLRKLLERCGIRRSLSPEPAFDASNLGGVSPNEEAMSQGGITMLDAVLSVDTTLSTDTFSGNGGDFGGGGADGSW